jgi:hemerythrin superfamily protein
MDATILLAEDHDEIRELFSDLLELGPSSAFDRKAILDELRHVLDVHAQIEEEVFYPAVRRIPDENARDLVEESLEQHDEVKLLMEELLRLDPAAPDFDERLAELRETVEQHAQQEEAEMFPIARERIGSDRLDAIGRELEALKDALVGALAVG